MTAATASELLDRLDSAVADLQAVELKTMAPAEQLRFVRTLEQVRRRVDHGTDRATGLLDASAAFSLDGHRNCRDAVKHLGRLPGGEALGRIQTIRAMQVLPVVADAYAAGRIPTAHMRLIARVSANPRVSEYLTVADPIFAERAAIESYDNFASWIRQWEMLADADGADRDDEIAHGNRRVSLVENFDGSWSQEGQFGPLQGASLAEIFSHFEQAEFEADWAWAREHHGPDATAADLPRTPAQRRACGEEVERDPNVDLDGRVCRTVGGTPLHPSDVLAAAVVGFVRRVVVDSAGTVIDLGRRRRLFTGSSREAAMLQACLRSPGGLRCFWPGCDGRDRCLQADHREPAAASGPTDVANSDIYCGFHNRLKERGFRPVRHPDGTWTMYRPDGMPITPDV